MIKSTMSSETMSNKPLEINVSQSKDSTSLKRMKAIIRIGKLKGKNGLIIIPTIIIIRNKQK